MQIITYIFFCTVKLIVTLSILQLVLTWIVCVKYSLSWSLQILYRLWSNTRQGDQPIKTFRVVIVYLILFTCRDEFIRNVWEYFGVVELWNITDSDIWLFYLWLMCAWLLLLFLIEMLAFLLGRRLFRYFDHLSVRIENFCFGSILFVFWIILHRHQHLIFKF